MCVGVLLSLGIGYVYKLQVGSTEASTLCLSSVDLLLVAYLFVLRPLLCVVPSGGCAVLLLLLCVLSLLGVVWSTLAGSAMLVLVLLSGLARALLCWLFTGIYFWLGCLKLGAKPPPPSGSSGAAGALASSAIASWTAFCMAPSSIPFSTTLVRSWLRRR